MRKASAPPDDADTTEHGDAWEPEDRRPRREAEADLHRGNGSEGAPPDPPEHGRSREAPAPLVITKPEELQGKVIPLRRWAVESWVPIPLVTGLYGDGGIGKSLLLQMLLSTSSLGLPWLDIPLDEQRALGVFCEDPEEELQRRQADINRYLNVSMSDLTNMRWIARFGMDNALMEFDGVSRRGRFTPFYWQLVDAIKDIRPRILLLDTVADIFGGNENDRQQVRFFVQVCLGGLARMIDGAVVASAHPSRSGLKSGDGDSGSTAWNAAFRSRLYLSAPKSKQEEGDNGDASDDGRRILERKKSNYGPRHASMALQWRDGVIVPVRTPVRDTIDKLDLDNRVLAEMKAMIEQGAKLAANWVSPRAFANVIRQRDGFKNYSQAEILGAQDRLTKAGRAVIVMVGPPSNEAQYVRPADMRYPRERKGGG